MINTDNSANKIKTMSAQYELKAMPEKLQRLCIPRVYPNIDGTSIRRIFDELQLGRISKIDMVSRTTDKGEKFNCVFIHFTEWFRNENADKAKELLQNGKYIKVMYDDPWFWKVSAYRSNNKKIHTEKFHRI